MKNILKNQHFLTKLLLKNVFGVIVLMTIISSSSLLADALPLENVTDYGSRTIPANSYVDISIPAVTANKLVVLRFNEHNVTPTPAGFNYNLKLELNSTAVPLLMSNGKVRVIGKGQTFKLLSNQTTYPLFNGVNIASMYASTYVAGNAMVENGLGSTFELIITDMVSSSSANSLRISNLSSTHSMQVDHIEVGYRPESLALGYGSIPANSYIEVNLPTLPFRDGEAVVLHLNEHNVSSGGFNYNARLELNSTAISQLMANGNERLMDKRPTFKLLSNGTTYPVFSGVNIAAMYSSSYVTGNAMTEDALGSTLDLNITDMVSSNFGNVLKISNLSTTNSMQIDNIEIEWRGGKSSLADSMTIDGITLSQGLSGGFSVTTAEGGELLVETAIGVLNSTDSDLVAADSPTPPITVSTQKVATGYYVTAYWTNVRMDRSILIENGMVYWNEQWTNRTGSPIGVPFKHRFFWNNQSADFRISGEDSSLTAVETAPGNPTLFVENAANGNGFGITAESDWLRLLMWMQHNGTVGEIYSRTFALGAYGSVLFHTTITPVQDNGGYWTFINSVRERWGANSYCMERPLFFEYDPVATGYTTEADRLQQSLGHLGPIYLATTPPWLRLQQDVLAVNNGDYPKLDPPTTPGLFPDLDVDAFLTFAHRDDSWADLGTKIALFHSAVPDVDFIAMSHPSMEAVYKPCEDEWPWISERILTADDDPFEDYSVEWFGDNAATNGWGVFYHVPRVGTAYLTTLLTSITTCMDTYGSDGIYCDEASFAFSRGYSRYDYRSWDGYSADLNTDGTVADFKIDNGYVTEQAQLQLASAVASRSKFFFCNTPAALRSINNLQLPRFCEGGNGRYNHGHLSSVPLVLGNFANTTTQTDVFNNVKTVLQNGCILSPYKSNLLLTGDDNFVCKLYPITIREIGPGIVKGEERLITTVSGNYYDWPGYSAVVRLYTYDSDGNLISDNDVTINGNLQLSVPSEGLIIAEIIP